MIEHSLHQKISLCFPALDNAVGLNVAVLQQNGEELIFCDHSKHKDEKLPYRVFFGKESNQCTITFFCKGISCASKHPGQVKILAQVITDDNSVIDLESTSVLLRGNSFFPSFFIPHF
jgi:hypothetical protein